MLPSALLLLLPLLFLLAELCRQAGVSCGRFLALAGLQASSPAPASEASDEELMMRYVAGERRAFDQLMRRYQGKVYGYIYRHFYDEERAAELFQDCFYKVIRAADSFDSSRRFSTWLFTIVRNSLIDAFKKKKLRMSSLDAPLVAGEEKRSLGDIIPDAEAVEGEKELRRGQLEQRLQAALEKLNPDQREVFNMRQFQGLPFAEIAVITDCPVNTAKTRMRYALEALRRELGDLL